MSHFDEVRRLFEKASELDAEAREAFLRDIEEGGLREEVRALLESDSAAGDFMDVKPDHGVQKLPEPGSEFGTYLIVRELGRGGTGAVFLARDRERDREVALKILHPLLWTTEESRAQLTHEAHVAERLVHPSIVGLHGIAEVEGWTVLVYQYVDGGSLHARIGGGVDPGFALDVAIQVASEPWPGSVRPKATATLPSMLPGMKCACCCGVPKSRKASVVGKLPTMQCSF